jgi:hypothetical protein
MMTSINSSGRRLYVVPADSRVRPASGPQWDPTHSLGENVQALAQWEWGGLRAEWVAYLARDVRHLALAAQDGTVAREWGAAVLCAAAVDAGRDRRASTWARTLSAITERTGVSRAAALARWAELQRLGLARPRVLPPYWRDHG